MNRNLILSGVSLVAIMAATACATTEGQDDKFGQLKLALNIEGEYEVSSIDVAIEGEGDSAVARLFTLDVSNANSTISAVERGLPPGQYTVSLDAAIEDDPGSEDVDESTITCAGSVSGVMVVAGEKANAELVLTCTLDGGLAQVAGAIEINAETELEVINNCPDLGSSRISPLDTSVGSSVQLAAQVAGGVGNVDVSWSANYGTISADGATYTCPSVAGVYNVKASFEREDQFENEASCEQEWTDQVSCHNSYEGPVETLPTKFAVVGTCGATSPCHLEQDGKAWQAVCGNRPDRLTVLTGEADDENSFSFLRGQQVCQGSVVGGELVAICTNANGSTCTFATDSTPAPDAYCPQVESATNVEVCSGQYEECIAAQDRCNVLLKCGDTYLGRDLTADGTVRINDYHDGRTFTCQEETVEGVASGSCSSGPVSCEYSAEINYVQQACEETMTQEGFILDGCGFDDVCVGVQIGCGWSLVCSGGRYTGVATETNEFLFTGPNGSACSGSVVNGEFVGSCADACTFAPRPAAAPGEGCIDLPAVAEVQGCQMNAPFELIQDGCAVGGVSAIAGEAFAGQVTATGVKFPGYDGYQCEVTSSDEEGVLSGRCLPPVEGQRVCSLTVTTRVE